jgi:hypothetical protein
MPGCPRLSLVLRVCVLVACLAPSANAQSIDDGQMIRPRELLTGTVYSYDSWDEYWEGALKRTNGNIGRITTRTTAWMANYGLSERLNIIGSSMRCRATTPCARSPSWPAACRLPKGVSPTRCDLRVRKAA